MDLTIRPLYSLSRPDLERIVTGYTSPERYRVRKVESKEQISFDLVLETLAKPYHKQFTTDDVTYQLYVDCLSGGTSRGAYLGERLVGVGIAEARHWNRSLWVWEVGIEELHRGKGIGNRLMQALVDAAVEANMRCLVCETQNTNVPAIRFYRRMGFELEGIDLSYYTNTDMEDFEVALFMKRKLG
jgi:streptothricin acetyltransferase